MPHALHNEYSGWEHEGWQKNTKGLTAKIGCTREAHQEGTRFAAEPIGAGLMDLLS